MSDAADRVAKGVAWMDGRYPGWREKIDVSRLSLRQARWCILGQVLEAETKDAYRHCCDPDKSPRPMAAYGMNPHNKSEKWQEELAELEAEWKRTINFGGA